MKYKVAVCEDTCFRSNKVLSLSLLRADREWKFHSIDRTEETDFCLFKKFHATFHQVDLMADVKILSYNDVVLRRSDLDILSGPEFLNDSIIEFYFSFLSSCFPSQDILLVPPSISFWIANCPDPESLKDFVEPLKLPDKKVVIFAVNNNMDVTMAEGGTHWSLLVYERNTNVFVHHDSIAGSNRWQAKRLYKAVVRFMGVSDSTSNVQLVECPDTPQQMNSYDCGLYVTAIAKVVCHWLESGGSKYEDGLWFSALKEPS